MRNLILPTLLIGSAIFCGAQTPKPAEKYDFKALMQQIWAGWETLDPANTEKFYDKAANRVFFDVAPLKYNGWAQYADGVKKVFADYSGAKLTLNNDARAYQRGNLAWGTATIHGALIKKSGGQDAMDLRWTVIWEKKGDEWLIIHEHVSTPPPPPPAAAKKK